MYCQNVAWNESNKKTNYHLNFIWILAGVGYQPTFEGRYFDGSDKLCKEAVLEACDKGFGYGSMWSYQVTGEDIVGTLRSML